ncbi:hypothetical protein [Niabella hirudinis]|uniref:hypothetical protein n=1 Tax=Niabella hirudinis TaxID=1285929 RepID=UPI003EBC379B
MDTFFGVVPGDHSVVVPAGCYMQSRGKRSVADAAPEGSNVMNQIGSSKIKCKSERTEQYFITYDIIINYVRNQKEHHKNEMFYDEYKRLLIENGVEFDEKYLL